MEFKHISYEHGTGKRSKEVETYNFHKAAAVLAEYGFDCIRLSDDWGGADFLAHHKGTNKTLQVQLKTCLVISEKYKANKDLYMCFPLDKTGGTWYLLKHVQLMEIVQDRAPSWLKTNKWQKQGLFWSYTGIPAVRSALQDFAYKARHGNLGFRECTIEHRVKNHNNAGAG